MAFGRSTARWQLSALLLLTLVAGALPKETVKSKKPKPRSQPKAKTKAPVISGPKPAPPTPSLCSQVLPQHVFTNHSNAGFVSYSAYRVSPSRFAIAGLGLTVAHLSAQNLTQDTEDSTSPSNNCSWTPAPPGPMILGDLAFSILEYPNVTMPGHNLQYEVAVLFCNLHEPTPQATNGGGILHVSLNGTSFSPYCENTTTQVHDVNSTGQFLHELVFCGPPVNAKAELRSIAQWMDYHLYYVGYAHMFVYDVAGFKQSPLWRFVEKGVLTIVDFQKQSLYPSWYYGQNLAMHDCLYRNRETVAWVAFGDFDEYLEAAFKPPQSIRSFLKTQQGAIPPVAWISRGCFFYKAFCPVPLWEGGQGKYAVELVTYRDAVPFCQRRRDTRHFDASTCPGAPGRRKIIVNPRMVEAVDVHQVYRLVAGVNATGLELNATAQLWHGHFRGIAKKGRWCKKPRDRDIEVYIDAKTITNHTGIAEIAAKARECALKTVVPTWNCK